VSALLALLLNVRGRVCFRFTGNIRLAAATVNLRLRGRLGALRICAGLPIPSAMLPPGRCFRTRGIPLRFYLLRICFFLRLMRVLWWLCRLLFWLLRQCGCSQRQRTAEQ